MQLSRQSGHLILCKIFQKCGDEILQPSGTNYVTRRSVYIGPNRCQVQLLYLPQSSGRGGSRTSHSRGRQPLHVTIIFNFFGNPLKLKKFWFIGRYAARLGAPPSPDPPLSRSVPRLGIYPRYLQNSSIYPEIINLLWIVNKSQIFLEEQSGNSTTYNKLTGTTEVQYIVDAMMVR